MYYEYWGLKKPAFDNVPDPSMYVDCHASMENAIAETLFAIEEGNECMAVIVGDVGLGKTMSLRMIIDTLDQEKYKMALITNPGVSFGQILQEIIGQLTGQQCREKRKVQLLEMFNRLLFSTLEEGRKILIFIDEANAITPMNLENLRLLTNMQGDGRNLFTMVLAGQIEFAKRLEHPKRANLFQRVGTYCRIDRLESVEKVRQYVETRLMLAGTTRKIFTDDAYDILWEQSDHGVPRLVNKLSKLSLKAGETNGFESITGEVVEQIGSCFHKLTGPVMPKRKSRKSPPVEAFSEGYETPEQPEVAEVAVAMEKQGDEASYRQEAVAVSATQEREPDHSEQAAETALSPELSPMQETPLEEGKASDQQETAEVFAAGEAGPDHRLSNDAATPLSGLLPMAEGNAGDGMPERAGESVSCTPAEAPPQKPEATETDAEAEMCIGHARIKINIPKLLIKQSLSATHEHRYKLAGGLAAETLKKYPDLMSSLSTDPVPIWLEIRDFVMTRLTHAGGM